MADRFNLQQLRGFAQYGIDKGVRPPVTGSELLALVDAVEAARSEGVQYALDWMTDGRTKGDQVRSDIERFRAALALFEEPA